MSLACSILYRLIPVDAPGTDEIPWIARRKGWPLAVELSGRIGLEPIAGTDEFYVRIVQRWIRGEAFHVTAIYPDGLRRTLAIPEAMRTDCGSIPRPLRSIPEGCPTRWPAAYVPHDRIFEVRQFDDGSPIALDLADWILLLLLVYSGCPAKERTVIYRFLRAGSWWVWYVSGAGARRRVARAVRTTERRLK